MEQDEMQGLTQKLPSNPNDAATATASTPNSPETTVSSQGGPGSCATCGVAPGANGNGAPSYIYALGKIKPRYPGLGIEKEVLQASGWKAASGQIDSAALKNVLSDRENRYLCRQLCWVLTIEGLDTYIVQPRDPMDFEQLADTVRPSPDPSDMDLIIGVRGPMAPPELCNGLVVPIVVFDRIYSFDVDALIKAIPMPKSSRKKDWFVPSTKDLFWRIMQMADNAGNSDEHRALNYLAVRNDAIYKKTSEMYGQNFWFVGLSVRPSRLSGIRKVVDAIFSYTHRETEENQKYFVRVDVTEEFPYIVSALSPYYVYDQFP